ncbi:MAG: TrbI/VirB10 family protein [Acidobacteriaceae bacterium]
MPEQMVNSPNTVPVDPELRRDEHVPRGVLQKNLKPMLYLGAALLVILAAVFSGTARKSPKQQAGNGVPQPMLQDNTANNVADLKSEVAAAEERAAQAAAQQPAATATTGMTAAQQAASAAYGPTGQPVACAPGQPCAQSQAAYQQQLSPAQQEKQQLAAKDRELAYASRFVSNLVFAQKTTDSAQTNQQQHLGSATAPASGTTSLVAPRAAGDPPANATAQTPVQSKAEINIDSASGQPYVLYEGTVLDTILVNRLDGDAPGPVKVMVSNPVYSHDRQHVLIPEGTIVLGEARKIGASGFGQQRRMAVVFHRMIMPDGYSVDLDQFQGLNQSGAEGLKDKVNNHYFEIFGTSIALGVIAGAGEITQGGGTISTSGSQAFATGASGSVSQSATSILDRFLQIPPTITIREGHRVKVYFTQDMLLPAYENHTIPQTF